MSSFEEKCVSVYSDLAQFCTIDNVIATKSNTSDDITHWEATWSHRDIERNAQISFRTSGFLSTAKGRPSNISNSGTSELNGEKIVRLSHCGNKRAILREVLVKDTKHDFLEIWNGLCKTSNIDLTDEDKHGKVHVDGTFGCMEWSHDGSKILYVAEKKLPKTASFFKKFKEGEEIVRGNEFLYKEDWGEQLVGSYQPNLYLYDVNTKDISDLDQFIPSDFSVSNAMWSKNDSFIIFVGWKSSPWKVGLIYCKNRLSTLFKYDFSTNVVQLLTDGNSCVFSPNFSPDGNNLVYLETIPFGPHVQCSKMKCINFVDPEPRLVVDVVNKPVGASSFQGLFLDAIPRNCWISDNQLVLHSDHRSNRAILIIDICTGNVNLLETEGGWTLLCISNGFLFASHSTPNTPPVLKAALYDPMMSKLEWFNLGTSIAPMSDIKWTIKTFQPNLVHDDYPEFDYEAILLQPGSQKTSLGLIVNPHGGPHVHFPAEFDLCSSYLCKLGFNVLRINFRGSRGFGQDCIFSLPTNVTKIDINDVQQAAEWAKNELNVPSGKVYIYGGSHGGFLTLQLVARFPEFYVAGSPRNPVTNFSSMLGTTDIVDWLYCEFGGKFGYDVPSAPEFCAKAMTFSPIIHVSKVKTPLLFRIGGADIRVPPSQSYEYIHALQGLGKKVRVLYYKDNDHPINHVDAQGDWIINMAKWFFEHGFPE
ncbi:acylamino-acid-releasing enzyme-like [Clavelina lepadiformis]|uniref:Acylamino-acid-releasing enzyme n=1 Tax=Clavelina lepadiformis TaxID=159417 RepID=A0ABP0FWZ9_CLALP